MEKIKNLLCHHIKKISIGSITVGILLIVISFALVDFNLYGLNPRQDTAYEIKDETYTITEVEAIELDTSHINVALELSESESFELRYEENEEHPIEVSIDNKKLKIKSIRKIQWFQLNWMNFENNESANITLKIPKKYVGSIDAIAGYGNLSANDINNLSDVTLSNEHGDMQVRNMEASNINLVNAYGSIAVENIIIKNDISIRNEHNDTTIKNMSANQISIVNAYGLIDASDMVSETTLDVNNEHDDVSLNAIQANGFASNTAYGKLALSDMKIKDRFNVTNEHGEVSLSDVSSKHSDFNISYSNIEMRDWTCDESTIYVEHGNLTSYLLGKESDYTIVSSIEHGETNLATERKGSSDKSLSIDVAYGDIDVTFSER